MKAETFQIPLEAAEAYEAKFVPRLFGEWASHLVEAADIRPGQHVLDVACGTGAVARLAAEGVGEAGRVVGLDLNEAMLTVARRLRPGIEWHQGDARELPFPDESFDVVLCQAALMYFPDVPEALSEMARVVTPEGRVGLQVWDRLESQPPYLPFAEVFARHAGSEALGLIETYFALGDLEGFTASLGSAGLEAMETRTLTTTMRFDSIDEFITTEVQATPLAERLSDDVLDRILEDSRQALGSFATEAGHAEVPITGHLIMAGRR